MKILTLIIKQVYFDAIMSGEKTQEFREVRPSTVKRLIQIDDDGYEITDEDGNSLPIVYDAIRFYVGYQHDRDSALVEIKSAYTEVFVDEDGYPYVYEYGTDKDGNPLEWMEEQVVYNLGKILEKDIKPKAKK